MGVIEELQAGIDNGQIKWNRELKNEFSCKEFHSKEETVNSITLGDNLEYMKWLLKKGYGGKINLIYIDPPFFTKAKYDATIKLTDDEGKNKSVKHLAYDDVYDGELSVYAENITARLLAMKELLSDEGLIWVHLDWHSSHYVKVLMDEVFGSKRFENEVIWTYKSGGTGKRHFSRKHDTLLVYSKTKDYYFKVPKEKSYNRGLKPYRFKGVKEYRDEMGWYTMVNMKDVWHLNMVGRTSAERNGYATQKPESLLKRIIECSTKPGDLCADFFCGSGSLLAAADSLERKFIGCDREKLAIATAKKRLDNLGTDYYYYLTNCNSYIMDDFKVIVKNTMKLESDAVLVTLRIKRFNPNINLNDVVKGDREFIKNLSEESPIELLDYLLIDDNYNGKEFVATEIVDDISNEIKVIAKGNLGIIGVDSFGNEYIDVIYKEGFK
ncbi:MAG: site-specific DNA-methyltransferase [Peptostreptococcaceae bacterium]|nr:site-specific DNA-methyltransferase [Peptostreptococcaceae bacterium]